MRKLISAFFFVFNFLRLQIFINYGFHCKKLVGFEAICSLTHSRSSCWFNIFPLSRSCPWRANKEIACLVKLSKAANYSCELEVLSIFLVVLNDSSLWHRNHSIWSAEIILGTFSKTEHHYHKHQRAFGEPQWQNKTKQKKRGN